MLWNLLLRSRAVTPEPWGPYSVLAKMKEQLKEVVKSRESAGQGKPLATCARGRPCSLSVWSACVSVSLRLCFARAPQSGGSIYDHGPQYVSF